MQKVVKIVLAFLGCAILGLVVTIILAGIGQSGVVSMQITHVMFWVAFGLSVLAVPMATWLLSQSAKYSLAALIGTAIIIGGGLLWLDDWLHHEKAKQEALNQPPPKLTNSAPSPTMQIKKTDWSKYRQAPASQVQHGGSHNVQTGPISQGPGSALSFNQQGGITAGTINNFGPKPLAGC